MDFLTTRHYTSKTHPEVTFIFRVPTIGRRLEFIHHQRASANGDGNLSDESRQILQWQRISHAMWKAMIKDFDGITIDGKKPSVAELFLEGPEDLIDEIRNELIHSMTPLESTDGGDEATIEAAERQIAEARVRIAARKNSEPQSLPESVSGTRTADDAGETMRQPNESERAGTAMATLP